MSEPTPNCSNCRHHSRQPRAQPLWIEENNGVHQMRSLDDDKNAFICKAPAGSPNRGKEFLEPVHCEAYSAGKLNQLPSELSHKTEEALERLKSRSERRED